MSFPFDTNNLSIIIAVAPPTLVRIFATIGCILPIYTFFGIKKDYSSINLLCTNEITKANKKDTPNMVIIDSGAAHK